MLKRSLLTFLLLICISQSYQYNVVKCTSNKAPACLLSHLPEPTIPSYFNTTKTKDQAADTTGIKQSNWYAQALKTIEAKEYEVHYDAAKKMYSSPNRKNNLRSYFTANTFSLIPRNDSVDKWKLDLTVKGIYAGKEKLYGVAANAVGAATGNSIRFNNNNEFITEYVNNTDGVRQNFIIEKQPSGNASQLTVKLNADKGWFVNKADNKEIHFAKAEGDSYAKKITYNGLKAWDANNKELKSYFAVNEKEISINVNTIGAAYPITIDPLSTTVSTQIESNQAGANMGFSVASAGDVNGDGYSDVIVGAQFYDNGQTDEGAAFIYHGSATGISSTYTTLLESNQASSLFGMAVSTAGDVNNDGYSDVIVGANQFTNGQSAEGAAFVYLGSATGISSTISSQLEINQANAAFGKWVACAGDVNGDGYSDVIVGANYYSNGQANEGGAFVYHGSATGIGTTIVTQLEGNQANGNFGRCVASAGDVNGDGYSDVIVGASQYTDGESGEGVAFVFHGSAAGITTTVQSTLEINVATSQFGVSVGCAGDINGDGYSDVIVGGNTYHNLHSLEGVTAVFLGSATGVNPVYATKIEGGQASAQMGYSVNGAGDINGDGYADIIMGAYTYSNGQSGEGVAFVYYGSAGGINTSTQTLLEINQANASFGTSVACAGDVNGDGYSDVIIGAQYYSNGQSTEGGAFVFHGGASGVSTTPANLFESNQANAFLGFAVGSGDLNGDGFSDVILGAYQFDDGESNEGAAFVYNGSAAGVSATISTQLEANQINAFFGRGIGTGDFNGDGYTDLAIGAITYDDGETDEGAVFIYNGSASGVSTTASAIVESNQNSAQFGVSISGGGDLNADGYSDLVVGAELYSNGEAGEGGVFVYKGSATGIVTTPIAILQGNQVGIRLGYCVAFAGDVNGDGYSDVIAGAKFYSNPEGSEGAAFIYYGTPSGINTTPASTMESNQASAFFGFAVAGAGDINGDGYSDVVVGANGYDNGQTNEGVTFVYYGSAAGLVTASPVMLEINQAGAFFGVSVASAGDVNGDGYSDIIVGASSYSNGQAGEGGAFIFYGSASGINTTPVVTLESNIASANFGYACSPAGDVNGDGFSDVVVGAYSYNNGQIQEGAGYVFLGNNGGGIRNNLRLYNTDLITPINHSNYNFPVLFGGGLYAKSFLGRVKGKIVWEVKGQGQKFSGSPITNSVAYTDGLTSYSDLGIAGKEIKSNMQKQSMQTKVRVRVAYDKVTAINGQMYGPWRYPAGYTQGAHGMGSTPLPISLLSFNGIFINTNAVQLKWITSNEINLNKYVIERSIDGTNFSAIDQLAAKGIGTNNADYNLIDDHANADLLYYRLQLVDNNGSISNTTIITVKKSTIVKTKLVPNPVEQGSDAVLNVQSTTKQEVQINMFNATGQVVFTTTKILAVGKNDIHLNTTALAKGMYLVNVSGDAMKESYRLMVQ